MARSKARSRFALIPKAIGFSFTQGSSFSSRTRISTNFRACAFDIANKLRAEPYLLNVRSVFQLDKPQLDVSIDRDRAAALGVSIQDISRTMQILFGGLDLSRVKREGKEYDVIVQLDRASRLTPQRFRQRLCAQQDRPARATHRRGERAARSPRPARSITTTACAAARSRPRPIGVPLGTAVERIEHILAKELPPGFRYEWAGEAKDLKETGGEIWFVLILAMHHRLHGARRAIREPRASVHRHARAAARGPRRLRRAVAMSWVNFAGQQLYGATHFAPPGSARLDRRPSRPSSRVCRR